MYLFIVIHVLKRLKGIMNSCRGKGKFGFQHGAAVTGNAAPKITKTISPYSASKSEMSKGS